MSAPVFDHQRLEELLLISANQSLAEAERMELNAILRDSAAARIFAARALTFDSLLTECLKAGEARELRTLAPQAVRQAPIEVGFKRRNWLARAAAWVGGFHICGNAAEAATATNGTILAQSTIALVMKKTVTSITAAILFLGGTGIYVIKHVNQSSKARIAIAEAEIQSLTDQLGIKTTMISSHRRGASNSPKTITITQVISIYNSGDGLSPEEIAIVEQFKTGLAAMDVESLKNLLLDVEKTSNSIDEIVAFYIMNALILKSPADATQIATQLIGRSFEFSSRFSHSAAYAFADWLAKDPAAADAWYVATAAAGGLGGKSIAPNGGEDLAIDRSFARLRLAAQVAANPTEAAAMMVTMLPVDVTSALQTITDPDVLGKILPALRPEQKSSVSVGVIKAMAVKDIDAAFAWANSLGMADRERDALMATGIEAAVAAGKLDLPKMADLSRNLDLDPKRRSKLLVSAAESATLIPSKNEHTIDPDNSVYWDRVPEHVDWLRKELPADLADEMVGDYLGAVSYQSDNLKKSLEAYENEVSRQGEIDPELTIEFAISISIRRAESWSAAALKLLNKLPRSEERDHAIGVIEMNR